MLAQVVEQDSFHLFNGFGMRLRGVAGTHHQLGGDAVHRFLEKRTRLGGHFHFGERVLSNVLPKPVAAVDRQKLGQQPALAMSMTTMRRNASSCPAGSTSPSTLRKARRSSMAE